MRIVEDCKTKNCKILTTFEQFEEKRKLSLNNSYHYVRIEFIGICGHTSSAIVTNFLCRSTGIRCKKCVKENTYSILKKVSLESSRTESESIILLISYLSNFYKVVRTKEGCLADLAISNSSVNDKYIAVQVKSTNKMSHNMYSFRSFKKEYKNMIIICICQSDNKIWVIPFNEINVTSNVNISVKSKYNKYLVENNNEINKYIDKYCIDYQINNLEELLVSPCKLLQREQYYVKKREQYINFIKYKYPDIQNTRTDFIVNNKKIQKKVCSLYKFKNKKDKYIVWFSSNNGTENKKRKYRTYCLGENDYYWLHSSIDDRFWIIPEKILYEKGFIANNNEIKNRKCLNLFTNKWLIDYEYNYKYYKYKDIIKLFQ